jgi:hypothetical protein
MKIMQQAKLIIRDKILNKPYLTLKRLNLNWLNLISL